MGKHYVPQEYLRGFADPGAPDHVWMFDKITRLWSHPAIKRVAQQREFYDDETEARLTEVIERPAHRALKKLRAREFLLSEDRAYLSIYVATMLSRGPRGRRRASEIVSQPGVVHEVVERVLTNIHASVAEQGKVLDPEVTRALDAAAERYLTMSPTELGKAAHEPWTGRRVLGCIQRMTWRFVTNTGSSKFLTTDTPAVFFEGLGLGHDHAELTFPVASDLALVASWQGAGGEMLAVLAPSSPTIKEINRRVAAGAERFVFSHRKAGWIETLALRRKPWFSRIVWRDEYAREPKALYSEEEEQESTQG